MLLTYLALMHHLPVVNNGCPMGTCVTVKCGSDAPVGFIFTVVASKMVKGECDVDIFFFWPTGNMFAPPMAFWKRMSADKLATGMCPQKEGTANSEKKNALGVH